MITPYPADPRYGVTRDGRVFRLVRIGRAKARELTQHLGKRGYYVVIIENKFRPVHRLVAETFLPNPEDKPQVAHRNGCRQQNDVDNLRWSTAKENSDDMPVHGTLMYGDEHTTRKLSLAQVREIKALIAGKPPRKPPLHRDIAARYGISRECVTRIANNDRWIRATAS